MSELDEIAKALDRITTVIDKLESKAGSFHEIGNDVMGCFLDNQASAIKKQRDSLISATGRVYQNRMPEEPDPPQPHGYTIKEANEVIAPYLNNMKPGMPHWLKCAITTLQSASTMLDSRPTDHADLIRRARSEAKYRGEILYELADALEQQSPQSSAEATDLQYPIRKLREWLAFRRENNSDGINSTTRAVSQSMAYILLRDHGQTILDALEQRDGLRERVEKIQQRLARGADTAMEMGCHSTVEGRLAVELLAALRGKED